MSYQITDLLLKVKKEDAKFIFDTIYSSVNFTDDYGLKNAFSNWIDDDVMPTPLAEKVEKEIRYVASNDIAYLRRKLWGHEPAGVPFEEIISDVANILELKINNKGSIEDQLIELTNKAGAQMLPFIPKEEREKMAPLREDERENILLNLSKKNKDLLLPTIINFAVGVNKMMFPKYYKQMLYSPSEGPAYRKTVPILIYLGAICHKVK
jgi:hypothetical protein